MPPASTQSFLTTRWSLVQQATTEDASVAIGALTTLCETYWLPIYAYFRRSGRSAHDAEDLTQGFFAWLLKHGALARADAGKGKLRTFLLTCAQHFMGDERDRAMAQKRGGGAVLLSFDPALAETRYAAETLDDLSPDRLYQRQWALAVLEQTLQLLEREYAADGKAEVFAALRPFLGFGAEGEQSYEEVAGALRLPLGTVKNRVFRLRQRWRELIFEQVSLTLAEATDEEVKAELSELLVCV
jgi:RNA polymerase sigma-70 factor (ECF subfamily)